MSLGLAFPWVAFIAWPTKNPKTFSFPARYWSTWLGFFPMISAIVWAMANSSVIWTSPFSLMIVSGRLAGPVHLLDHFLGHLPADRPVLDEADHLRERGRRDRTLPDLSLLLVQKIAGRRP